MPNFWSLLKESVIIQGVLTLGLWGAIIFLAVTGAEVPEILTTGGVAILGFWFGSKTASVAMTKKVE